MLLEPVSMEDRVMSEKKRSVLRTVLFWFFASQIFVILVYFAGINN
jgi:hypothetical protein